MDAALTIPALGAESILIAPYGLVVPEAVLRAKMGDKTEALLRKLIVYHQPKVGPREEMKLYKTVTLDTAAGKTRCILLPRVLKTVIERLGLAVGVAFAAPAHCREIKLQIELFDNQKLLVRHLVQEVFTERRIRDGTACAILNLRPGMGKTFVAGGLIEAVRLGGRQLRTLYVVPKRPLAVQAVKDLRGCFDATIGQYASKGKGSNHAANDITVIVIDSALKRSPEFFAGYSFVIYDEVHMYCTDIRREIFRKAGTWACLGMSGTTENRKDGFDVAAHKELAFDGIIRAENVPGFAYGGDTEFKTEVTVVRYKGPQDYTQNIKHDATGKIFTPFMNKQFVSDPHRMKVAVDYLVELYQWVGAAGQRHNIYVFCEELEPLRAMQQALREAVAPGDLVAPELMDVGQFVGGMKTAAIEKMVADARVFLTTYGYAGTGVSMNKMTAIMFLTPRRSGMLQILPRILRRGGDLSVTRRVIDIVDVRTVIKYQYVERAAAYEHYGMNVTTVDIKYTDVVVP